jgi:hypothetical protein
MKQILITITLFFSMQILIGQSRFEFSLSTGIGYDFQTRSNDYNLTGPLYIPANGENSILHIEKPYQHTLKAAYHFNDNFGLVVGLGTSNRALRYWSLDDRVEPYSYWNDKINLGIRSYHIEPGIRLRSKLSNNLNIFWDQTFGIGFGKSSPRSSLTKDHPQAELIYLQNQQVGVLVNVNIENPIFSINSNLGMEYRLFKNTFLMIGLKYINEVSNGNNLILWQYDLTRDIKTGAYAPYDLEFKSIFTEFGIKYEL